MRGVDTLTSTTKANSRRKRPQDAELALRRANVLLEVSRRCAAMHTLDGLLQTLVEMTSRELACDRGTLFLNDAASSELYSRVAQGGLSREIRILNNTGLAGHVFQTGEPIIADDAYADPRFNPTVDERTGYRTRSIICVPVRTLSGDTIGVMQCLNKHEGSFTRADLELLADMTSQAAVALQSQQYVEQIEQIRLKEKAFLQLVSEINSEFDLSNVLVRVVAEAVEMLNAERATIFLHDPATGTLFSRVFAGSAVSEIRFPSHLGIAGTVFTSAKSINIPYAYADLRFNPSFDRQTGFFTRSILCVPIVNAENRVIGVTQVLNKKGGVFTDEDEQRLKAFTAQIAIALENSKLFDDVRRMKEYNDAILESMSSGVVTLDAGGKVVTCNVAGGRIFDLAAGAIVGEKLEALLDPAGAWILDKLAEVRASGKSGVFPDATVTLRGVTRSVDLTIMPLLAERDAKESGSMLMIEDLSTEKRMMSTMSRYMDPVIAAQMLAGDAMQRLGGVSTEATVMFTDIRNFTPITEEYGAHGTVAFLNEYFSLMVECIGREGGMLDKFIGDAIMACFGLPVAHDDDPDRAVRAAIAMIRELWRWNATRRAAGLKTVDMGVGINTDQVVSGNIGSPKRMDYTVIGDGVNLASRLESACKAYSARILVSETTVSRLRGIYRLRDVDLVVVKGKSKPVRVMEVLDYHDDSTFPHLLDVVHFFNEGVQHYRRAGWHAAAQRFRRCLQLNPGDTLSQTYVERCQIMAANPPDRDWNGTWVMKDK
jgi:adenylate cyclase